MLQQHTLQQNYYQDGAEDDRQNADTSGGSPLFQYGFGFECNGSDVLIKIYGPIDELVHSLKKYGRDTQTMLAKIYQRKECVMFVENQSNSERSSQIDLDFDILLCAWLRNV